MSNGSTPSSLDAVPAADSADDLDGVGDPDNADQPATRYRYADGAGEIGVIASVTEPFCDRCDRVRITADGRFRTCLFALEELDMRDVLRSVEAESTIDDQIARLLADAVATKWAGHRIGQVDFIRPERSMSQIGG